MIKLETEQQYRDLKDNNRVVFLFSANWCSDCRLLEPIMPEIEADFADYTFVYVDRDQFIDVCIENDVFGIPSFIVFSFGTELGRFVSKEAKTKDEVVSFLQAL
ncbi:thioredoxin family protein [Bacillus massiliigorillae]|uniref:thioredoxin family protein n=1 Tax=Bacillus massiliigorillae TaxID=1243664 RepID=UPI0003A89CEB|nr:thioredoxin family protein [Bacillus massiliigorillae]